MSVLIATTTVLTLACGAYNNKGPEPPQQDQCKPVGTTEPAQCPGTIGPPCPPCYSNTLPDYSPGMPIAFNSSERAKMAGFDEWYLNWWAMNYPADKETEGPFIFLGSAGRGNIFLRKYLAEGGNNATLLSKAEAYISASIEKLPVKQSSGAYMSGHVGVWFLMSVIHNTKGENSTRDSLLAKIKTTFENMNTAILQKQKTSKDGISLEDCTLDTGLSGMLYGALLYNTFYKSTIVDTEIIANLAKWILDFGVETGVGLGTNYLQYESFSNCYLWGPGHGSSGIVKTIFTAVNTYPEKLSFIMEKNGKYYVALQNTIDFYVSIQLEDGNIPTNIEGGCKAHYGSDNDARVQWCHGAPGFLNIFLEAGLRFENASYTEAGIKTATVTWNRGLLVKGTMFCHGIGGNVNMFHEASKFLAQMNNTHEADVMAYRAKQFTLWTLDWGNLNATRLTQSNEGYSMYQGNYAVPMVYAYTSQPSWPQVEVCQPGWNLCV
eukprot:TRINITY_DN2006_c0_g2_i1.p1 TRINITY_DN2006_c0_g2~~TRINITY_DN2006_c0_g2_i1.p1  ORF type:complete len:492 (+),score=71.28 TRINITY_DN2006_c0_g2_i1:52-1527(+)